MVFVRLTVTEHYNVIVIVLSHKHTFWPQNPFNIIFAMLHPFRWNTQIKCVNEFMVVIKLQYKIVIMLESLVSWIPLVYVFVHFGLSFVVVIWNGCLKIEFQHSAHKMTQTKSKPSSKFMVNIIPVKNVALFVIKWTKPTKKKSMSHFLKTTDIIAGNERTTRKN